MIWTVYSMGDCTFLTHTLEAAAMIFNTDLPDALAGIGLVLAVFWQGFRSLSGSSGNAFGQIFTAALLYVLFFVPRTEVSVQDVYTGETRTVDGVPLGPAAAGGIISGIGQAVSNKMADAFSLPEAESRGFASSIRILGRFRKMSQDLMKLETVNTAAGGNFSNSWLNYFRECTMAGIDTGELSPGSVFTADDILKGSRFDSKIFGTSINVNGTETEMTCTEASDNLSAYTKGIFNTAFIDKLADYGSTSTDVTDNKGISETDLKSALNALGQNTVSTQNYMLSTVLLPLYMQAAKNSYQNAHDFSSAIMLAEAKESRNTAMVAEQGFFFTMIRPLMTFFESFIYGITPLIPFIAVLGNAGITALGRYLMIMLWTALWHPLLTLVNFYILAAATRDLSATSITANSLDGLLHLYEVSSAYLALGSSLAAAVPVLAMSILWGGSMTLSGLLSKASPGNSADTGIVSPSLLNAAPLMSSSPTWNTSLPSGTQMNNSTGFLPGVSFAGSIDKAVSNAETRAASFNQSFSQNLAEGQAETLGNSITASSLRSLGRSIGQSSGKSTAMVRNVSRSIAEQESLTSAEEEGVRGAVSAVLGGGISQTGSLLSNITGSFLNSKAQSGVTAFLQLLSGNESLKTDYTKAVKEDITEGRGEEVTSGMSKERRSAVSESAARAVQAEKQVSELKSMRASSGFSNELDGAVVSKLFADDEKGMNTLLKAVGQDPDTAKRMNELIPVMNKYLPDPKQACAAASLTALLEQHPETALNLIRQETSIGQSKITAPFNDNVPFPNTDALQQKIGDFNRGHDFKNVSTSHEPAPDFSAKYHQEAQPLKEGMQHMMPEKDSASVKNDGLSSAPANYAPKFSSGLYSREEAYDHGRALGLSTTESRIYADFSAGELPAEKDLDDLKKETGSQAYSSVVSRLQEASNGNDLVLKPVVAAHTQEKQNNQP